MKDALVKMAMKMALPTIIDIVKDMIKNFDLAESRDKVLTYLRGKADTTATEIDDKLVESLVPALFLPETIRATVEAIMPPIKAYVQHSATKYDDKLVLPIIEAIEELVGAGDDKAQ